jgi:hypothetical protein
MEVAGSVPPHHFTVGSNGVLAGGIEDDIAAGTAGHGVMSCVLYQNHAVGSRPSVHRILALPVEGEILQGPSEDHMGPGPPIDPVPPSAAVDRVGTLTAVEMVLVSAAADRVVSATRPDPVEPRPADEIRVGGESKSDRSFASRPRSHGQVSGSLPSN